MTAIGNAQAIGIYVLVDEPSGERRVEVGPRLFIGRECSGVDPAQRLIVTDVEVSRHHCEIRLEEGSGEATLLDTSSNGTRLNGSRIERGAPVLLADGDRIIIGGTSLVFRHRPRPGAPAPREHAMTARLVRPAEMTIAVGDIVDYSSVSEVVPSAELSEAVGTLFGELRKLLHRHGGAIGNYAGDALFALWELEHLPDGADRALRFALAARDLVAEVAERLSIRDLSGEPLRMGWGVVIGEASTGSIDGAAAIVLGDAANLAFRLSSVAGRDQRPEVLATATVLERASDEFARDEGIELAVKGRAGPERVFGIA